MSPTDENRAIRLEVEVPGTPEQVWEAIATGPGIQCWFVPGEVDGREGGEISLEFSPGSREVGRVTAWEPPHRFAYAAPTEGEGRLAFEWLVEARSGGTCVVRLVNSGFGSGEDWDREYDAMSSGWTLFLDNLRLYLTHFRGLPCASMIAGATASGAPAEVWRDLTATLGLAGARVGDRAAATIEGAAPLGGEVVRRTHDMVTLLLEHPAPGVGFVAAEGTGERAYASVYLYLFGERAAEALERDAPVWRAWLEARYPSPATA